MSTEHVGIIDRGVENAHLWRRPAGAPREPVVRAGHAMHHDALVRYVEHVGADRLDRDAAGRAVAATLTTLARCLPAEAAGELADQLPAAAKPYLTGSGMHAQRLSLAEFLEHVAELEGVSPPEALDHARTVMDALRESVTGHEMRSVRLQLPDGLGALFALPAAAVWPQTHRRHPHA